MAEGLVSPAGRYSLAWADFTLYTGAAFRCCWLPLFVAYLKLLYL